MRKWGKEGMYYVLEVLLRFCPFWPAIRYQSMASGCEETSDVGLKGRESKTRTATTVPFFDRIEFAL